MAVNYPDGTLPVFAISGSAVSGSAYHRHTGLDWEFVYIRKGSANVQVVGRPLQLKTGDLLTIGTQQAHACESVCGVRSILMARHEFLRALPVCIGRPKSMPFSVDGVAIPRVLPLTQARRPAVEFTIDRLGDECHRPSQTRPAMCKALLTQFLVEISRAADEHQPAAAPVSKRARDIVESFADELRLSLDRSWSLNKMADRSGYSPTQLSLLFRQVTGMSPIRWLTSERVRSACDLLTYTDQCVVEIAGETGFGSRSQLHRSFRSIMGMPPGAYRQIRRHETHR